MRRSAIAVLFSLAVAAPGSAQVALGRIHGSSSYSPITGWVALIDLSVNGAFEPRVTGFSDKCGTPPNPVALNQTDLFAQENGTLVAITANTGPNPGLDLLGQCGRPSGMLVDRESVVIPNPPGGLVLYFDLNGKAHITDELPPDVAIMNAVGGTLDTDSDCGVGTLLVDEGKPGKCPIPKSKAVAERGAIGLSHDGNIMIIVTIDGLEGDTGLKTADLAAIMIGLGAHNAINFDGGGSTSFIWSPDKDNPPQLNQTLQNKMLAAKYPPLPITNPNNVQFKCVPLDVRANWKNSIPYYPTYRPVYAQFGLMYMDVRKKTVERKAKE